MEAIGGVQTPYGMASPILGELLGYEIVFLNDPLRQEQTKRHRKRRIDKKWRKRYGFKSVLDVEQARNIFVLPRQRTVYVYRSAWEEVKPMILEVINRPRPSRYSVVDSLRGMRGSLPA